MFYTRTVKEPIIISRRQWSIDGRGALLEGLRCDDKEFALGKFGQAYVTTIQPGIIKAWHMHKYQIDRMILIKGLVRFGCIHCAGLVYDPESRRFVNWGSAQVCLDLVVSARDPYLITIPETIYHGFRNVGDEEAFILNIPTNVYNREQPDESRIPPIDFYDPRSDKNLFDWDVAFDG